MANGSGPLVRNGTPIDGGRVTWDGRRVLGDGKTYEGLILALTYGTTVGVVISSFLGSEWIVISFFGVGWGHVGRHARSVHKAETQYTSRR